MPNKQKQRNPNRNFRDRSALHERDFNTQVMRRVSPRVPTRNSTPVVTKVVRYCSSYQVTGSTAYTFNITPTLLITADANDYGIAVPRYQVMRVVWAKLWVSASPLAAVPAATVGALTPQSISLTTGGGIADFAEARDQFSEGVDMASVGLKLGIQSRAAWVNTGSVTPYFQVNIIADPALTPATLIFGNYTVDVLCEFR